MSLKCRCTPTHYLSRRADCLGACSNLNAVQGRRGWWRSLPLLSLLSVALFGVNSGTAQQAESAKAAPTNSVVAQAHPGLETEEGQAPKARGEGIKVHGHWVLDVKGVDGKIVQHRDFENSLVGGPGLAITSGDQLLAGLLSGTLTMDNISVVFLKGTAPAGSDLTNFCSDGQIVPSPPFQVHCFGFIPTGSTVFSPVAFPLASHSPHFNVDRVFGLNEYVTFAPSVSVVLTGNYVIPGGLTEIDAAQTFAAYCGADANYSTPRLTAPNTAFRTGTYTPAACHTSIDWGLSVLTSTPLAAPLTNLVQGQTITVTVTLSFS